MTFLLYCSAGHSWVPPSLLDKNSHHEQPSIQGLSHQACPCLSISISYCNPPLPAYRNPDIINNFWKPFHEGRLCRLPRYKPAKSVIALAWACLPAIFVSSAAPKLPPSAKCPKQSLQILLQAHMLLHSFPSLCSCSSLCQVCAVPTPPSQIQSHHQGAIQMPPPLGSLPDFWQLPPLSLWFHCLSSSEHYSCPA